MKFLQLLILFQLKKKKKKGFKTHLVHVRDQLVINLNRIQTKISNTTSTRKSSYIYLCSIYLKDSAQYTQKTDGID